MAREALAARLRETDLYVVITESFCAGRSSLQTLERCLEAGVRIVQLREKRLADGALFDLACHWRARTREANALFIVDDRVDIALAAAADGVHLGCGDLPVAAARRIAPELIIGASSHNLGEALAAQDADADYVNIGPVFPTQTKETPTGDVGPELIAAVAPHLRIPFTCMGGIKLDNVDLVLKQGAQIVAVVTAVTAATDQCAAA
ncbi:MAG TPA: thiamine phosphate synthase, partial [Candidatus Hydrogenedentes bacterium]|nr:thiamine phosphate synthase [Candidatus Hydrogenedentota bacterium]